MDLYLARRALECLLATSLLIQSLEFLRIRHFGNMAAVWSWEVQKTDVAHAPAWLRPLFDWLYQERIHRLHLLLRTGAAASLYAGVSVGSSTFLFVSTILILIRWRGAFNGGSDFMTLVGLTGLLIAHVLGALTDPATGWRGGLWYICLQTLSSYFVSGWIKLLRHEWRTGRAMTVFLDTGIYGPLVPTSIYRSPRLAQLCSWAFTLWEGFFPLALMDVRLAMAFCAVAIGFHFLVFWFFGLNRFVWAWLASYPAVLYCAT